MPHTPQPRLHSTARQRYPSRTGAQPHDLALDVLATASLACQFALHPNLPDVPSFTSTEVLRRPIESTQYTSYAYGRELAAWGFRQSFTATGACLDNAYIESFFATLKKELVYQHAFASREEARKSLFAYINVTYNRYRLHSSLGYQSPDAFEATPTSQLLALAA